MIDGGILPGIDYFFQSQDVVYSTANGTHVYSSCGSGITIRVDILAHAAENAAMNLRPRV
jgi:hypothetical protein